MPRPPRRSSFPSSLAASLARRGALTALLVVGVATLAIGWAVLGRAAPVPDTIYREAVVGQPLRINPLATHANQAEADLSALIFSGLMRLRPDGLPEPALAERWEVTPDGLTYTFHLRRNVTWHDGAGFSAEDVAFTIDHIQSEGFTGPEALRAEWADVQVFVADAVTLMVRLPEPSADFLARATLGILPRHLAEEMDTGTGFAVPPFDREPIGTGPYRLVALDEERAVLRHNTAYALGAPLIPRLELRFASTGAEQLQWLADGDVDAAFLTRPDEVDTATGLAAERADLQATVFPTASLTVLYLNHTRGHLSEAATRRALSASVDPLGAITASEIHETPASGVIPPGSWAHVAPDDDATDDGTALDVEALWTAAGWERGASGIREREGERLTLELVTNGEPDRVALAQAIAAQLTEAGVEVELVTAPAQRVVTDYLRVGVYDLALFGWQASNDPDPYAGWHTSQIGAGNVAAYSDPEADALMEVARTTLDTGERRELYALFQARFAEQGASVVIAHPQVVALHRDTLQGVTPRLLARPEQRFANVHDWWMQP